LPYIAPNDDRRTVDRARGSPDIVDATLADEARGFSELVEVARLNIDPEVVERGTGAGLLSKPSANLIVDSRAVTLLRVFMSRTLLLVAWFDMGTKKPEL
jgi:hypothetical protein